MVQSNGHDVPMQPNEIKRMFHIATISSKIPRHIYIKNLKSLYRIISQFNHSFVGVIFSGLRDKQYKVTVHFHILNKGMNVVSHF